MVGGVQSAAIGYTRRGSDPELLMLTSMLLAFTMAQVLHYPYATELASAERGDAIAWVRDVDGARNVWFAHGPAFAPIQLTHYTQDDGQEITQITFDERTNWFPHVSPDRRWVLFLSYPPGTEGHPADRDVLLRIMRPDGTGQKDLVALHGGQGTINVNSWAPDSSRFAFVAYPIES